MITKLNTNFLYCNGIGNDICWTLNNPKKNMYITNENSECLNVIKIELNGIYLDKWKQWFHTHQTEYFERKKKKKTRIYLLYWRVNVLSGFYCWKICIHKDALIFNWISILWCETKSFDLNQTKIIIFNFHLSP